MLWDTSWPPDSHPRAPASCSVSTIKSQSVCPAHTHQTPGPHLPQQQGECPNGCLQGLDLLSGSRDESGACVQNGRTALSTKSQPCAHLYTVKWNGMVIRAKSPDPQFPSPEKTLEVNLQPTPPRPRRPGPSPFHVDLPVGRDSDWHVGEGWDVVCWV